MSMSPATQTVDNERPPEEIDEIAPLKYAITSYGADYPVDSLVKRLRSGDIYMPEFQRNFVWDIKKASKFVESLLLGLPVPGIFLSREDSTQKMIVIDGQQRLLSLLYFYDGVFADTQKEFRLIGVQSNFEGLSYKTLSEDDRRRLDDSIIHATIVRQDEPSEDESSIYLIFERLNTGGLLLLPQEIRASIYHGRYNDLLKDLNQNSTWRSLFGPTSPRLRDQELILRFFALYFESDQYSKPMKDFLNRHMSRNRNLVIYSETELRQLFEETVNLIGSGIGRDAFRLQRGINAAQFDAVMFGIARRQQSNPIRNTKSLRPSFDELLNNREFLDSIASSTTDEEVVKKRLSLAERAFSTVR
ncbi:MAG: DUF262 domain-containing protein [Dehalococcoidia bacterium]